MTCFLFIENGFEKLFDGVIVVMRQKSERVNSVKLRSGLSEENIIKRIESNHPLRSSVYRFGLAHIRQCLQQLAFSIPGNFVGCGCLLYFGGVGGTFQWRSLTDG